MAVRLEFLNLLIPIHRIEEIYPDGWSGCLRDHAKSIGRTFWHDPMLVRAGGLMDSDLIDSLIQKWTRLGFIATEVVEGQTFWQDICLVDSFGFSKHQCSWLVVGGSERIAWLRGTERGEVFGREQFK
ncbi:hypothetical protein KP001_11980 [Geomonas subterranea]|uniref:Uncharacterized protein n=1 Tax=Geomonas subterranea TaxID=2847989 RepID=A0ABX8LCY0_9BACT|nr:hypothetical protein [Geomonas subterranea]QXE89186.1 hypothetical protein KP001_11980 [Geomonas subterranea]QXM08699.1 hypothetical protein KP002_17295 [Geomonas subterranea]